MSIIGNNMTKQHRYWVFLGIFFLTHTFLINIGSLNADDVVINNDNNNNVNEAHDNNNYGRNKMPVIELTEDNWRLMLKGEWMVEFFAPWCPACKNLAPTWERFAAISSNLNINVAKIDVTTSTSLSGRFFVTALPTIYHVKDGDFRQYRGSRDFDALMYFIKQKQWSKLEPISAWKKPDTIHMSILSYVFKLSHTLKEFNARLQEEYGLPSWAAYAFFAIGTIFVGAVLGLMLVCIIDLLYTPKKTTPYTILEQKHKLKPRNEVEELANDEIEDDASQTNVEENDDDNDDDAEEVSTEEEQFDEDDDEDDDDNNEDDNNDNDDDDEDDDEDDQEDQEEEACVPTSEKNTHTEIEEIKLESKKETEEKLFTSPNNNTTEIINNIKSSGTNAIITQKSNNDQKTAEVRKRKPRKDD